MSSYSGDAAEQVVRMSLEGTEVAVRLAGSGAKQLAILLYAVLKDQKKTRGKIRLTNMLRSGKELKVFAVKDQDIQKFCVEAKKYGRFFKLYMYTAIAPVPLASFAGEPTQSVGKSFLKSYAAVCLEGAIIVLPCFLKLFFSTYHPPLLFNACRVQWRTHTFD